MVTSLYAVHQQMTTTMVHSPMLSSELAGGQRLPGNQASDLQVTASGINFAVDDDLGGQAVLECSKVCCLPYLSCSSPHPLHPFSRKM